MDKLTIVIPYFNGEATIGALLDSLPAGLPVIVVDDQSDRPFVTERAGVIVLRPQSKGYFAGAVNAGIAAAGQDDVLILNQDVVLDGTEWLDLLAGERGHYAMIGERIAGTHPAFPLGYSHGTFLYLRRDAIERVGLLNGVDFPLWGNTAEWQWRAARKGFAVLPLVAVPGFRHLREKGKAYGSSIRQLLSDAKSNADWLIRTPPLVSVIIPCYNHGRFLADAVNSLIGGPTCLGEHPGQTLQAFEIIIVNDGSTDESGAIADSLADGWKGIRAIHQTNQGTAAAHNAGIRAASGRYITTMSADDMREAWGLEKLYRAAVETPRSVTYDDIRIVKDNQRRNIWKMPTYNFEITVQKNQMHVGILFPKAAWADVGGYPEAMREGREDWAFNIALGRKGWCGLHVEGEPGYLYRRHNANRTLRNTSPEWRTFFLQKLGRLFPDIFRGERPMGCCGKSNQETGGGSRSVGKPGQRAVESGPVGSGGMTLLEYAGDKAGTEIWGGQGAAPTGTRYTFGKPERHRIKWVDNRDVPYFLGLREKGKSIFRIHKTIVVEEEEQEVEILLSPGAGVVVIDTSDGIDDTEASAAGQVLSQRRKESAESEDIDPANLTVAQIRELAGKLDADAWAELLAVEKANKNRSSAIAFIEGQMAGG